jgi:hypothetical protein
MFHTYVGSILSGCCICFAMTFQVFSGFFSSVLDVCFNYFICLQTYVANVSSRGFKVDKYCTSCNGVAHLAMTLLAGG